MLIKRSVIVVTLLLILLVVIQNLFGQTTGSVPVWTGSKWQSQTVIDTVHILVNLRDQSTTGIWTIMRVKKSNLTVLGAEALRTGGTSATVNIRKNGTNMFSDYATTTSWGALSGLTGASLAVNDVLTVRLVSVGGTPTDLPIQIWIERRIK